MRILDDLRERARRDGDAGVALLLVVLTMAIVAGLSLLLLAIVVNQARPTSLQQKTSRTISAAQAGVDAVLTQIRTAQGSANVAGNVFGNPALLPCRISGTVGQNGDAAAFSATVTYYNANPVPLSATDRASHRIACTDGAGTTVVPRYALIVSAASGSAPVGLTASAGNRTVQSLYTFQVKNQNVPGGLMWSVNSQYCLQAGSVAAGATITYTAAANCVSGDSLQTWVYDTDYTLKLASAVVAGTPLCISAANPSGTATLATCDATDVRQQYSYQGGANFRNQVSAPNNGTANQSTYGSSCLGTASRGDLQGGVLVTSTTCDGNSEYASFSPDPKVGAGAASVRTTQIVNYLEFGRCMDVTNQNVASSYMIVYPCKQDPSGGTKLAWNHKFAYTEPQAPSTQATTQISVLVNNDATTRYCLKTPAPGTSPAYVTFTTPCSSDASQQFVRTSRVTTAYAASYTFRDTYGRCLAIGPKQVPANNGVKWSTIVAAPCTGGSDQKWNADAGLTAATLTDTRELTGAGS
ncbi:hypothetical protein ACFFKU_10840 [Kineococcus gynurae]|uniref:Ricin-type beta-trefoil lectin protein n=1 Tax=Kineococcus gynurae TaxID=452979 RepID=A0ABV5LUP9_9ACTN